MSFRLIFTTILVLVLSAGASHAEPVSAIVTAIGAVLKAGGLAAALLKGAFAVAVNVGMGLIQQARARKAQRKQESRGTTLSVQFGDTQPLSYIIGTRATAGRRYYAGTWGKAGKTPNAYATDCRVISSLPSFAGPQGIEEAWFGDTKATILWDQPHPEGLGFPVKEFRSDSDIDYLWVKYYDGSQTAADPFLLARFGAVEDYPYKPTMIGRGCQLAIFTCRVSGGFFPNGFPDALFVPKPMKLYDIRRDSTAGGSGLQRWDNPATWASSDLLPVMMYNIARGIYYDGKWVHGGRNFAAHRLPASSWMAAINEADREMEEGRKQFRGGLEVFVDEEPLDTLEDLRVGCAGRLAEVGGALKLQVGSPAGAVYSFTDANVVVTSDQDFEPFPSITATHNTITGDYPEPKERWAYKDAPQKSSAELVARDGGQVLPVPVRFGAVPFSAQVQSLMTAMIAEEQRWRIHNLHLPPDAIALEPNDVLSWSSEKQYYSTKRFIAVRVTRLTGSLVRVLMKEMDPNDYDPPEIILPVVTGWVGPIVTPPHPMFDWDVQPAALPDATGAPRRPSMQVSCAPDQDGVRNVWIQVRLKASGVIVYDMDAIAYAAPFSWILNAQFLPASMYQARGRYVHYRAKDDAAWGEWKDVLTPNILLGDADVYLPGVVEELQGFVDESTRWIRDGVRQTILDVQRLSRLSLDQDFTAFRDRQTIRQEVASTTGDNKAFFLEQIDVATGPNSALSRRMTIAEAKLPGISANARALELLTARVTNVDGKTDILAQSLVDLSAVVADKVGATAFSALTARVTTEEGKSTSQAASIIDLQTQINGKAAASAVSLLQTRVETVETTADGKIALYRQTTAPTGTGVKLKDLWAKSNSGNVLYVCTATGATPTWTLSEDQRIPQLVTDVQATADAITSISAGQTTGNLATANFRMGVSAGPAGYASRIMFEARTGGAGSWRSAGLSIDVPASTGTPTRIVLQADQIAMTNGATVKNPFVFEGSVLYVDELTVRQANIINLMVTTSNIAPGAVSAADSAEVAGGSFSSGNKDATVTIAHGSGSPTVIIMGSSGGVAHPTGTGGSMSVSARAGSTTLNTSFNAADPGKRMSASVMGRHIPASGTTSTTYSIRASFSGTTNVDETNIVAFVLKR